MFESKSKRVLTQSTPAVPDSTLRDPYSPHPLAWVALAFGIAGTLLGTGSGISMSSPPRYDSTWTIAWAFCGIASLCAVLCAWLRKSKGNRLVCHIAMGAALLGAWCPTYSFFGNYHTYPWIAIGSLILLSTLGSFLSGLRVVGFGSVAFIALWFGPVFLPASHKLPMSKRTGELECRLNPIMGSGVGGADFELTSFGGDKLARIVDLNHVEVEGQIGPLIPIRFDSGRLFDPRNIDDPVSPPKGSSGAFTARVHGPEWARSFNLQVRVRRWPEKPWITLTLPLTKLPQKEVRFARDRYSLSVSNAGWGNAEGYSEPKRCLNLSIGYSGFSYSGFKNLEYGIWDDLGNCIPTGGSLSSTSTGNEEIQRIELVDIDPKAKSVSVRLFTEADTAHNWSVFDYGRVSATPNKP